MAMRMGRVAILAVLAFAAVSVAAGARLGQRGGGQGSLSPSDKLFRDALGPSLVEEGGSSPFHGPNTPCDKCQHLITAVATRALRFGTYSARDIVMSTQFVSQQIGACSDLSLQCSVYSEVKDWLFRTGLIAQAIDAKKLIPFRDNPSKACHAVNLCGAVNLAAIGPVVDSSESQQAAFVRLRLRDNIASIPKSQVRWRLFVKLFLNNIAKFLKIAPTRLALHQHSKDRLAEVVIQPDPTKKDKRTPLQLGHILKTNLAAGSTALHVPSTILNVVNTNVQAQVAPLVVPIQVATKPAPPAANSTLPSCNVLKANSKKFCGNTFSCSEDCRTNFIAYHGRCLSKTMDSDSHQRVFQQFQKFFTMCAKCTSSRVSQVRERCGFSSATSGLPPKCSAYCAAQFVPYYDECLSAQSEGWSVKKRTTVDNFYTSCRKCTVIRASAVKKICDTRKGPQLYHYPATCTPQCSKVFPGFYDECFLGAVKGGVPTGAEGFRYRCGVARHGGVFFRVTVRRDITTLTHQSTFKTALVKDIAAILHVPRARLAITSLTGTAATKAVVKTAPHVSFVQNTPGVIIVDALMRVSDNPLAPDPGTVVDRLRLMMANPSSKLFHLPVAKYLDSAKGLQLLVPNTHDVAVGKGRTSLQLATAELQKAIQHGAAADVVAMLKAIVEYHTSLERGAATARINANLARVSYAAVKAHKAPADALKFYKARLDYAEAVASNKTADQITAAKALADYLGAVYKKETGPVIAADKGVLEWANALASHADQKKVAYLHAVMLRLRHVAQRAKQSTLDYDKAMIKYMEDIMKGANNATVALDKAMAEYLLKVTKGASKHVLAAAKALVDYRKAIESRLDAMQVKMKKAELDYAVAVEQQKSQEAVQKLAALVTNLHKASGSKSSVVVPKSNTTAIKP